MAFRFFENAINSNVQQTPDEMYRDLEQEFINMQFCNTSALVKIKEQVAIGSDRYRDIEVWIDSTVADTTTGLKDSNDFNKLFFKDINHEVVRGLMYKFDNNYWIVNNFSKYSGLAQQCGIRRCNNRLKIVDPLNGKVQVIPCCVDYDMTSPSAQTSRYIITPNNHATVIVQGNDLTLRLFKTNTRYILSGRPFKLLAYQNAVEYSEEEQQTTLLYLDLYLDELHDGDDLINDIADNGIYDYIVELNCKDMALANGANGVLKADVILNGEEVERAVVWSSDNEEAVTINSDGEYIVIGEVGAEARIYATLFGNEVVWSSVLISIVNEEEIEPMLTINPIFDIVRQYDTITFVPRVEYNGQSYSEFDETEVSVEGEEAQIKNNGDGSYDFSALKITQSSINLNVSVAKTEPPFSITKSFQVNIVSMMG